MEKEIWQKILVMESQEGVKKLFNKIHNKTLNTRRANEISATVKQAREYFRNANYSSFSVKPLLTFYGVSSLGRALSLMMREKGGEEGLTSGYGLSTEGWSDELSGDLSTSIKNLGNLKIRTTSGLFSDFIWETSNVMCIHLNSSEVDWMLNYPISEEAISLTFSDLLTRLPDLQHDFSNLLGQTQYSPVNSMKYTFQNGFECQVWTKSFDRFKEWYEKNDYEIIKKDQNTILKTDSANFKKNTPQFVHSYIQKSFGSIPNLYLSCPLSDNVRFSQLGLTFLASYFLGMLVRYFPTHWTQMINGGAGDVYWPIINRLENYIEQAFPELAIELIIKVSTHSESS